MKPLKLMLTLPLQVGTALEHPRVAGWTLVSGAVIRGGSEALCLLAREGDPRAQRWAPRA
jgi:hypothetical protein